IALHPLVLSMGQSLLQNGLFQRGKVNRLRGHEAIRSDSLNIFNVIMLSDPCRTPGFLRITPVDPGQQIRQLRR
ncbi:hypothetical protein, partial [Rhizobium johnstonii]|uniref:hypothetical protein n=1 Tax=Rhizobium johnstonii TaxID=3019933 RepID=UPI003F9DD1C9